MLDLSNLGQNEREFYPLSTWDPPFCGEMDLRIDVQGQWHHLGKPIARSKLVKLFERILWFNCGRWVLRTPVEELAITVDDLPFVMHSFVQFEDHLLVVVGHNQWQIKLRHADQLRIDDNGRMALVFNDCLWARLSRQANFDLITLADGFTGDAMHLSWPMLEGQLALAST